MMRSFGVLSDGRSVEAITLRGGKGLEVEILTYGAILRRLSYPVHGKRRELILHFDRLADYERDSAYVGPVVGRFGNRIANAAFTTDRKYQLTANEGANHLHGSGPGLQFYNGQFLSKTHPTLGNGVILEPQGFPDAPNEAAFPPSILRPGELYRAHIAYRVKT